MCIEGLVHTVIRATIGETVSDLMC